MILSPFLLPLEKVWSLLVLLTLKPQLLDKWFEGKLAELDDLELLLLGKNECENGSEDLSF